MRDILFHSATRLAEHIATGELSSVQLMQMHFDQVDAVNGQVNAVIWQDRDAAMAQAKACDTERARGDLRGPLHGVPITVKESFDLRGSPTTWGRPDWAGNIAAQDSDVVARYKAAGGIVFGKTNVPLKLVEWQSFNEIYGSTSNPWNLSRTPGGSSGGAAAALACGMSALEVGSDIGASIRNPAHYCGVFGLKPTWNSVSLMGHLPPGWYGDMDIGVAGPMARTATDLTLAFDLLAGPSHFESTQFSLRSNADARKDLADFRVAVFLDDDVSPIDAQYRDALSNFARKLEEAGASVFLDKRPEIDSNAHFSVYLQLLGAALSAGVSDEDVAQILGSFETAPEDVRRIAQVRMSGLALSHRQWLELDNARRKARLMFDAFFEDVDVLLAPVCSGPAFEKDEAGLRHFRRIDVSGSAQLEMTQLFWAGYSGVVGLPSVVGPMDQIGGLPVGYQAICGHGRDRTALAFTRAVERELIAFTPPPLALQAALKKPATGAKE